MQSTSLRYFYEAAQAGSMRAAGDKMGVAVSSISRQIAQLETEFGLPLIERGRRTIKLTQAGELAVNYYRRSLAERDVFDSQVQDLRGMRSGRIDLAMGEGFINAAFSQVLSSFLSRSPDILVSTVAARTAEVARMVVEDEVHAGLVFHVPADPKIRVKASVDQPIVLLVRPGHPLDRPEPVRLADIAAHRVCMPPEGFRIRQIIAQAEAAEGVWLKTALTANALLLLKELAKSGDCVTLLPRITAAPELIAGTLKAIPIAASALETTSINLITRLGRQLPAAALKLLTMIEASLRKGAGDAALA
jgi:DNA-binding transcriptional LysR family regulator